MSLWTISLHYFSWVLWVYPKAVKSDFKEICLSNIGWYLFKVKEKIVEFETLALEKRWICDFCVNHWIHNNV